MKYSICIEMIYKELDFYKRIEKAKKTGFDYFEFWTWERRDINRIKGLCMDNGINVASFSGDDRFSMISAEENTQYVEYLKKSIETARILNCSYLVIHSDALNTDGSAKNTGEKLSREDKLFNIYEALRKLEPFAEKEKIRLVLEPLNSLYDHKEYFLDDCRAAFDLVKALNSKYIAVLYDVYHMQIMKGNIIATLEEYIDYIGYIHVADVPGRHEPGTGELNYKNILGVLKGLGYDGMVGFELEPASSPDAAVDNIKKILV